MSNETNKLTAIRDPYTKAQLFGAIAEDTGLSKKEVAAVFESLNDFMLRHLKSRSAGTFTLPGLAKFTVNKKPAKPGKSDPDKWKSELERDPWIQEALHLLEDMRAAP